MTQSPKPGAQHILVTGGAGFIGSHLVERLLSAGHVVTVLDDLSTGTRENLSDVESHPNLRFIHSRLSAFEDLPALVGETNFIFHLAAAVGVDLVVKSPLRVLETNLHETEVLFEAAAVHHVPLLLTSTSEVYGKSSKPQFSEDDDLLIGPPTHSRWSYACSKLMDEFLALAYHREQQLPVIIVRLFNTVGPRQSGKYGMVLPRFVESALSSQPLRVFGDGTQTRCFCDVFDVIEALIRLSRTPEAAGEVVNVGSTDEISILALAGKVIEVLGSVSGIDRVPYEAAYTPGFEDMLRRRPNIDKLEKLTGFRPQTGLVQIIKSFCGKTKEAP